MNPAIELQSGQVVVLLIADYHLHADWIVLVDIQVEYLHIAISGSRREHGAGVWSPLDIVYGTLQVKNK